MSIKVSKYQAAGNDFVLVDNRSGAHAFTAREIDLLCDRRFGVGADGLILLVREPGYDFRMIYYNRDGSQSFCGNGCRAVVHFAHALGVIGKEASFMAHDGPHRATILDASTIRVTLGSVAPMVRKGPEDFYMYTGTDHHVRLVSGLDQYAVVETGRSVRYSDQYPRGANVNFLELDPDGTVHFRIYERGVEDETYSSGSGATACALVAANVFQRPSPVSLRAKGGRLEVGFKAKADGSFEDVYFQGPVSLVFQTEWTKP